MTRRQKVVLVVTGGALLLFCGGLFLYLACGINDSGSPELASEWRAALEPLRDPEEAKQENPSVQGKRYADGEWVFGLCQNSHELWRRGGGTLVIKDSRKGIRTFFGHVCGPGFLGTVANSVSGLDEFYERLQNFDFAEDEPRSVCLTWGKFSPCPQTAHFN